VGELAGPRHGVDRHRGAAGAAAGGVALDRFPTVEQGEAHAPAFAGALEQDAREAADALVELAPGEAAGVVDHRRLTRPRGGLERHRHTEVQLLPRQPRERRQQRRPRRLRAGQAAPAQRAQRPKGVACAHGPSESARAMTFR
jgi:hypothetical protein